MSFLHRVWDKIRRSHRRPDEFGMRKIIYTRTRDRRLTRSVYNSHPDSFRSMGDRSPLGSLSLLSGFLSRLVSCLCLSGVPFPFLVRFLSFVSFRSLSKSVFSVRFLFPRSHFHFETVRIRIRSEEFRSLPPPTPSGGPPLMPPTRVDQCVFRRKNGFGPVPSGVPEQDPGFKSKSGPRSRPGAPF